MSELKPCPFCEGEAILQKNVSVGGMGRDGYFVLCQNNNCQAEGPFDLGESGAIEAWNARPIEDELRARVEELEKELSQEKDEVEMKSICIAEGIRTKQELESRATTADGRVKILKAALEKIFDGFSPEKGQEGLCIVEMQEVAQEALSKIESGEKIGGVHNV